MRIAVVGAGISGLSAAWLLAKNGHAVTLFEKEARAGGHAFTCTAGPVPVDLGFQVGGKPYPQGVLYESVCEVYNLTTYPHFVGFLEALGVDTEPSDMSFGLSLDGGALEWASHGLESIFAQRQNLVNPHFWRMLYHVVRFGKKAPEVLLPRNASKFSGMTLGEYIERDGYGEYFKRFYLLPMCAAVWSVPFEKVLQFPVVVLVQFWVNHHLLDLIQRPVWRVVKDRSVSYVDRVLQDLKDVRLGCAVQSVSSENGEVKLEWASGCEAFDKVVMATHSDVTLKLLGDGATAEELAVLKAIPYECNSVYLHTDASLMPKRRAAWASWNFVASSQPGASTDSVCVSYWLNRLQNLKEEVPELFITLNPSDGLPRPDSILHKSDWEHPIFKTEGVLGQERLPSIQGARGIYFCGAWSRYGFHEDGIRSSVAVAQELGCSIPWTPRSLNPKISTMQSIWLAAFDAFAQRGIKRGALRIILPNGSELQYGDGNTEPPIQEAWKGGPPLSATVRVFNMGLFWKTVFKKDTGFAESYAEGDFDVDDLGSLMNIMAVNAASLTQSQSSLGIASYIGEWLLLWGRSVRTNTINGSKRNIRQHYDMGNALYKLFLDRTMTYSAGLHVAGCSLEEAQLKKLDRVIQLLELQKGDHVLEIGCGWGSFAIRAAEKTGCKVTGLTLSYEQLREGSERVKAAGLQHLVQLMYCDYRHVRGQAAFDKVVSIEMIEAVGHEHLDTYFGAIGRLVKPGGKIFIQAITIPNERYGAYCASSDFIRECIFPGGHLPSMDVISSCAAEHDMAILSATDIGSDYALTLREWRQEWQRNRMELLNAGCSLNQHRMFEVYFAYCEAGFKTQHIHDYQITLQKSSIEAPLGLEPVNPTADHFTQALLAIYFFLAGIVVMNRPYMWLTPIASAALVMTFAAWRTLSSVFTFYREMNSEKRIWWTTHVVRFCYAAFMALLATTHLLNCGMGPLHGDLEHWELTLYCSPVCMMLGFCGFQVWNVVYHRLYVAQPLLLVRHTVMLIFLGVAAFKVEQVGLISFLLLSEWNVLMEELLQIGLDVGVLPASFLLRCLSCAEKGSFLLTKVLLQLYAVWRLMPHAPEFFSAWSYSLAFLFVLFCLTMNLRRLFSCSFFCLSGEKQRVLDPVS